MPSGTTGDVGRVKGNTERSTSGGWSVPSGVAPGGATVSAVAPPGVLCFSPPLASLAAQRAIVTCCVRLHQSGDDRFTSLCRAAPSVALRRTSSVAERLVQAERPGGAVDVGRAASLRRSRLGELLQARRDQRRGHAAAAPSPSEVEISSVQARGARSFGLALLDPGANLADNGVAVPADLPQVGTRRPPHRETAPVLLVRLDEPGVIPERLDVGLPDRTQLGGDGRSAIARPDGQRAPSTLVEAVCTMSAANPIGSTRRRSAPSRTPPTAADARRRCADGRSAAIAVVWR